MNVHKYIITLIGIVLITAAIVYHVIEDGGPYQPLRYAMDFPWQASIPLFIGLIAVLSAKSLPARKP